MANAARQCCRHITRPFDHSIQIKAQLFHSDAITVSDFCQMINLSRAKQCLGWNTAPVKANSAQIFAFHNRGFQPKLAGSDCRHITPGATPDDNNIIGFWIAFVSHDILLDERQNRIFDIGFECRHPFRTYRAVNHPMIAG